MGVEISHRCIKEPYLICDMDKNCLQCIIVENKITQRWINQYFIIRYTEIKN